MRTLIILVFLYLLAVVVMVAIKGMPDEEIIDVSTEAIEPHESVHAVVVPSTTAPPTTTTTKPPVVRAASASRPAPAVYGSGACGGDLPPCSVMRCESGGNIRAENPRSSASGKWQIVDGTWAGFGGYARASHAPEEVQDAKARLLWAGGRGAFHWKSCL